MDVEIFIKQTTDDMPGRRLKEALENFTGITHVTIHFHKDMVEVGYNPEITTLVKICDRIEALGWVVDR